MINFCTDQKIYSLCNVLFVLSIALLVVFGTSFWIGEAAHIRTTTSKAEREEKRLAWTLNYDKKKK
jgi:hypothetical protein